MDTIEELLGRAWKFCDEGQLEMSREVLTEVNKRMGQTDFDPSFSENYSRLCAILDYEEYKAQEEKDKQVNSFNS